MEKATQFVQGTPRLAASHRTCGVLVSPGRSGRTTIAQNVLRSQGWEFGYTDLSGMASLFSKAKNILCQRMILSYFLVVTLCQRKLCRHGFSRGGEGLQ